MNDKFDFAALEAKAKQVLETLPDAMGNVAVNFFLDSFKKQAWEGVPWKKRAKNLKRNRGKDILIQSGRLRRSLRILKQQGLSVSIGTDVPYARIHNEGGTINHGERKQVLHFGKRGFAKVKKARYAQKVTVGAHTTTMPRRQFMGNSPVLEKQVREKIKSQILNALK